MTTSSRTIVATGASSGLGFELVKHLLACSAFPSAPTTQYNFNFILGAREASRTLIAYNALNYDHGKHTVTVLPLELNRLQNVKAFAEETIKSLGSKPIDFLLLNAAITIPANVPGETGGSNWCEALVVNHWSQHYLVHLLRDKLMASKARLVFVSSGAIRQVETTTSLKEDLGASSKVGTLVTYGQTKFVALLAAHWWRRTLSGTDATVVAVSPGLIPATGIGRGANVKLPADGPDAKSVEEGAVSLLEAFTRDDYPEDPDRIFLTSWGEWWPRHTIGLSTDKKLQDEWCLDKEGTEKEFGL